MNLFCWMAFRNGVQLRVRTHGPAMYSGGERGAPREPALDRDVVLQRRGERLVLEALRQALGSGRRERHKLGQFRVGAGALRQALASRKRSINAARTQHTAAGTHHQRGLAGKPRGRRTNKHRDKAHQAQSVSGRVPRLGVSRRGQRAAAKRST
jgi:hypothetical protein